MNFDMSKYTRSKWLKGSDLPLGRATPATIKRVYENTFEQTGETKPVIEFLDLDQHLVLNKSQVMALINLFGTDAHLWANQRITLMPVPSNYQGKPTIMIGAGETATPTFNGQP
jgi:hypothetical protein